MYFQVFAAYVEGFGEKLYRNASLSVMLRAKQLRPVLIALNDIGRPGVVSSLQGGSPPVPGGAKEEREKEESKKPSKKARKNAI